MINMDYEVRAFLEEFQSQPEDVRELYIYVICQTMVQAGALRFLGVFGNPSLEVTHIYQNIDTEEVFEIVKPALTSEEEQSIKAHISELLQDTAQAA